MRITIQYQSTRRVVDLMAEDIIAGRSADDFTPGLDLGEDSTVSRKHARIWLRDGAYWVQDLGSTYGTFVNDIPVDYKRGLNAGDQLRLGETLLTIDPGDAEELPTVIEEPEAATVFVARREPPRTAPALAPEEREDIEISSCLNAEETISPSGRPEGTEFQHRLALLIELPLQFAAQTELEPLFQLIVERVVRLVPGAQRGALLLYESSRKKLLLKAHHPPGEAAVSETLARRALTSRQGFIWNRQDQGADPSMSMQRLQIHSGMYVPLLWNGEALGVLCVDNTGRNTRFEEDDLRFALSIAHYAGSAVANRRLQAELETKSTVLERLLTQFSPKLRAKLVDKALSGKLRPGGEKSEVTILFSDIRGFTTTSATMDAQDVMDMLNDYFPPLVQAIFTNDGTVDKFVGDAILAVFGSPEPDAQQHQKAVLAALAMQEGMKRVNARRKERGEVACEIGIGIHCGEVLHGFIGAAERLEFTVIGDTVNKASRYCAGAKAGEILLSQAVYEHAYGTAPTEKTTIPTKHEGDLVAYRVKPPKG